MKIQVDNTVVSNNIIKGYSGGKNYGISNNGATTKGVKLINNTVQSAIWNLSDF